MPVAVGAALALTMSPAAASQPAAAVRSPGWRVVQFDPNLATGGIAALGANNAWLAGDGCANSSCDRASVLVRHWDGKAWRVVTAPKGFVASATEQGVGAVAASSATNMWVFDGGGTESVDYTSALHWTGKNWTRVVRMQAAIQAAVAPSADDAWAFGDPNGSWPGYAAHFNGKTWTAMSFPVGAEVATALSADDIWVGGINVEKGPRFGIAHWNGKKWQLTPLPSFGAGTFEDVAGIAAITPRDAWADLTVSGQAAMMHWNGKAWARAAFPYRGDAISPVASDGHGGIWLSIANAPGSFSFCHYSGGHWTKTPAPSWDGQQVMPQTLTWIPGTRSLWAAGGLDTIPGNALLNYGS